MSDVTPPVDQGEHAPQADHPESAGMTADELSEAKRYGRQGLACLLADKALDLAYLAVAALLLARPLDHWLAQCPGLQPYWSLRLVALLLIVYLLHLVVSWPLSCYSGFVLEHRYGLSKQTPLAWLWDYLKYHGLALSLSVVLWLGLYWLIWTAERFWWLAAAAAAFAVSVVLARIYPILIMPLFRRAERLDDPALTDRLARLTEGTGLRIEGVYRRIVSEDTVKLGASLAGLGRTRRVHLDDTLLGQLAPEEIEVVMAHEIGHHVFHHLGKIMVAGVFVIAAEFWLCDRLLMAWTRYGEDQPTYATLPVYTLPMLMLLLTVFGTLLEPLQNFVSRHFERQCDRYALRRTGNRQAYQSAFRKLARLNKDDPNPHPLEVLLLHSHPPIAQRLAMAEEVKG